jgi:predicted AlkP superfamily phosphohydrolase/phosphomutase
MRRALVIGLDSLPPWPAMERWGVELPCLRSLVAAGASGRLRSSDPPITVPAWASMLTGRDPGALGLYGFRDRADRSYHRRALASSDRVGEPWLWERVAASGGRALVIGVPPTWPPRVPPGVTLVTDFLTPSTDTEYTAPPELADEIARVVGAYALDVEDYRSEEGARVAGQCLAMAERRLCFARHLLVTRPWELAVVVEIATDRLLHALLHHLDPAHPRFVPGSALGALAREVLERIDRRVGDLVEAAGEEASVLVVSDHGTRPLLGGLRVNEWLRREGFLVLRDAPAAEAPFDPARVDWRRTAAWAEGGYVARIHLNRAGREPEGRLTAAEAPRVGAEIAEGLAAVAGPEGPPLGAEVRTCEELWSEPRGVPPDLVAYLGELGWRALGGLGPGPLLRDRNDGGPDAANHARYGFFALREAAGVAPPAARDLDLLDVVPSLLERLGLPLAPGLPGVALAAG